MATTLMRGLRIVLGFLLLAGGLIGWLLPIIPGWALVIPGLLLLGREFQWARRLLGWLKSYMPKFYKSREGAESFQAEPVAEPPDEAVGKRGRFRDNISPPGGAAA